MPSIHVRRDGLSAMTIAPLLRGLPCPAMVRERWLIGILTAVNFTHILDFVILMPLGPQLMRVFGIEPSHVALAVSAYSFSAAAAGVAGAFLIDRFDRKRALIVLLSGFILATGACALAPTFAALVWARIAAGACGGVLGALVLAIVADEIPHERRGAANGVVMAAFSLASITGVPAALAAATCWSWHAPFILLAGLGVGVLVVALVVLPPMRSHLGRPVAARTILIEVAFDPGNLRAFAFMAVLMLASFAVIPFISQYLVGNVGFSESDLPYLYLYGGICSVVTSPWIGRLVDRLGARQVFTVLALASIVTTVLLTRLGPVGKPLALACTTLFIVVGSGRYVPAMTLIASSVAPARRGSFMSLNSAVQSAASGLAAWLAGLAIGRDAEGHLTGYDAVGLGAVVAILVSIVLAWRVRVPVTVSS